MAPEAEDCEEMERLSEEYQAPRVGRRVQPGQPAPAQAWLEHEDTERSGGDSATNSPGENRRLLSHTTAPPLKHKSRLQAGLTLGVANVHKKHTKCPQTPKCNKPKLKTKYEKRKEKLIDYIKPPYFIVSMIILIVCIHVWVPRDACAQLQWAPGAWLREPWRLLTYGVVHASAAHLTLNAVVALAVGWRLEREQGWWRVVVVWVGGVAAGALGAGALQPHVRVVGASAAVYALLTAHLPNVCLRFGHIPLWWFRPLSVVVLAASEACWALVHAAPAAVVAGAGAGAGAAPARAQHSEEHVAWSAHLLGAAVGVPLAFIVFTGENDSQRYLKVSRVVSLVVLLSGVVAAALHFSFWYEFSSD